MTVNLGALFVRTSIPWLWVAAMAGWAVIGTAIGSIQIWRRSQKMAAMAQELGFTYVAWQGPASAPKFETSLFQNSFSGFKNVMTGSFAGMDAQVFDYSRTTGSQSRTTSTQTVAIYQQNVALPLFALEPQSLAVKIVDAIQHQHVDLDCSPDFSRHYAVHGPEKEKIRSLFNSQMVSWIEGLDRSKGWHIEGTGKTLVLYRYARRVKPTELRGFLEETSSIAQSFFAFSGTKQH